MENFELGYNIINADYPNTNSSVGEMAIALLAGFDSLSVGNADSLDRVLLGQFTFRNYLLGNFFLSARMLNLDYTLYNPLTTTNQEMNFYYSPEIIPPDFDGDGTVDMTDLLFLLEEFGCTFSCNADLDANGQVGISDLITFIYYFNAE